MHRPASGIDANWNLALTTPEKMIYINVRFPISLGGLKQKLASHGADFEYVIDADFIQTEKSWEVLDDSQSLGALQDHEGKLLLSIKGKKEVYQYTRTTRLCQDGIFVYKKVLE